MPWTNLILKWLVRLMLQIKMNMNSMDHFVNKTSNTPDVWKCSNVAIVHLKNEQCFILNIAH